MAIPITCGECRKQFKVKDEHAGRKTRCTGCGALIRIPGEKIDAQEKGPPPPPLPSAPAVPPPPPEMPPRRAMTIEQPREEFNFDDPIDEEPVRFGSSQRRSATTSTPSGKWQSVASGLNSVAIGGCVIALNVLAMLILPHIIDRADGLDAVVTLLNWLMGIVLLTFVGFILGIFGRIRSQKAPNAGVRNLAGVSSILAMIATGLWGILVLLLVIIRLQMDGEGPGEGFVTLIKAMPYVLLIAILLAFIAEAMHARMLVKVNEIFRRDGLALFAQILFIVFLAIGGIFALTSLLSILGVFSDARGRNTAPPGLGGSDTLEMIQQIAWLASTIAYVILLFMTSRAMSDSPPPPRRSRGFDEDDAPPRRRSREREDRDREDRDRERRPRRPRDDYDD